MTPQILFYLLIFIVILSFCFSQWISYLNTTMWNDALPEALTGFYDAETYRKQQLYGKENYKLELMGDMVSFVLLIVMLSFGGFAWLDNYISSFTASETWRAIIFLGILALASDVISIPFEVYDTFIIEEKFGFNKTTVKTFILDKVKAWVLAAVIGGLLLALIIWLWQQTAGYFWIWAWVVITIFSVGMGYFYTSVLLPVFNKLTPLEEGTLKNAIENMAQKAGFSLRNVKVMDGSKRSTKANAFFSGFGKRKTIVLFDTLINNHSEDEIVAVLAHEIGHYKKKHIVKGMFLSVMHTGILMFLFSFILKESLFSEAVGVSTPSFHISLLVFGILYTPVSTVLGIFMNKLSRKHEFEADKFAAQHADALKLQEALKKLSVQNLSNLTPHPYYVFVHYSHPPLLHRLKALNQFNS